MEAAMVVKRMNISINKNVLLLYQALLAQRAARENRRITIRDAVEKLLLDEIARG